MGRIKTKLIKRMTKELYELHGDKFAVEYKANKLRTNQLVKTPSKKLRNIIAGYMTRLKKHEKA